MELTELTSKFHLRLLLIFGSHATGRHTDASDLDVAYQSEYELSSEEEQQLLYDLTLYFKKDQIDLVNFDKAGPLLAYEIACNSKVLYGADEESYLKLKLKASARYADTQFLRDARKQWLNEQISKDHLL